VCETKGVAFLLLMLVVTMPLSPIGGVAGGLIALAVGQFVSVKQVIPQSRWRLRASSPFGYSLVQMLLALFGFAAVTQLGIPWLGLNVAVYALSLWISDRRWAAPTEAAPNHHGQGWRDSSHSSR
jgi:hypothetical protein